MKQQISDKRRTNGFRGFMLDSARCQENRAYYRNFIDFAATRGINQILWHFSDDQGCSLQFDLHPEIASPHAYSKKEMRELIRYATDRGIELVPELASLGHSRYLTKLAAFSHLNEGEAKYTGMCPVSEETRQLVRQLIEETAAVFESPNLHVGLDEIHIGDHPLTQAALQTQTVADLLADYTCYIRDVVVSTGKRMWMWGDSLLKHPIVLGRVPRDVVICNWQYTPDASPDTTRKLLDAGFDVVLSSALISYDQPLFPGEQFAVPNVRTLQSHVSLSDFESKGEHVGGKVLGHLNTIWTPIRFIADSLWVGVDLAAKILSDRADVDSVKHSRKFAEDFYGLTGADAASFGEVVRVLLDESPMRSEWLAVVRIEPLSEALKKRVRSVSPKWTRAEATLKRLAPAVQKHDTEYDAFTLLIELIAHSYDASAELIENPANAANLLERGQSILDRVEQAWDRERFADDPRKYTAPIASYQCDHLIPLIQTGVDALKETVSCAGADAIEPEATLAGQNAK